MVERLASKFPAASAKPDRILLDGYVACLSATIVFAVALLSCYSNAQTRIDATQSLLNAIYVTSATVLVGIAVMFELAESLQNKMVAALSLSIVVGLAALAPTMAILGLHPLLAKAAILLVSFHVIRLLAREGRWRRAIAPALSGAVMGYWTFLLGFVDGYKTPWIAEATMSGHAHVDLLFHSAIVNMLRSYGIGSIGVDGASPFPYYFGSHRIVELLSRVLNVPALAFYSVVFPLLLGPVFLAVFFFYGVSFQTFIRNRELSVPISFGTRNNLFWLLFAIVFIGVFPAEFRRFLGLFDNVFHSESFGIGMVFAYPPGVFFFEYIGRRRAASLNVVWPIVGGLYLAGLCMVKLSVACVVAGASAYLLLRLKISWRNRVLGFLAAGVPLCYGVSVTRGSPSGDSGPTISEMIKPLAFLRDTVEPRFWLLSFVAFFGPFIMFVLLRVLFRRNSFANTLMTDVKARELLDVEVLTALLIGSVIPGMVLSIPQGATNFFSEVSYWFVLPMLAVTLSELLQRYGIVDISRGAPVARAELPNG
ncbi:hypothetical protein [Paraburkholderia sp. BCC1884]|uniref:hypothetical protein n=1 Tax=Paraburkholderia sp. BCC1884 TaxID=2562668 RepID=UPI0011835F81|nr:hypothetical protein [Paraburkholderia sp. BCC1884]